MVETEYLIMVSRDLSFVSSESADAALTEIREIAGMLHSLRLKVEGKG